MSTLTDTAREAADAFEAFTRDDDGPTHCRVSHGAPEWVRDLARKAHGTEMLPDDWRYECIYDALRYIADNGDDGGIYVDELGDSFADGHVDVYNAARTEWLGSHSMRAGYVDEARDEGLISEDTDILARIGVGQYLESREVFERVLEAVREYADEDEDEDDDMGADCTCSAETESMTLPVHVSEAIFEAADAAANPTGYADDADEANRRGELRDRLARDMTALVISATERGH